MSAETTTPQVPDTTTDETPSPAAAGAVAQRTVKGLLDTPLYREKLKSVLRDRAPQFAVALVQVVNRSWQLQRCDPNSVIGAAITAAALDLSLDQNLGEAHLVPYGEQCQFQLGYKGFVQLAMRSGQYHRLGWSVIREGELLEWNELTGDLKLDSAKMNEASRDSRKTIGYASYFSLVNGFERSSYWSKEKVEAHAARYSQAYRKKKPDSPWFTNFDTMALKTVLKDLLNHWGPKSVQMQRALIQDQQVFYDIDKGEFVDNALSREGDAPAVAKPIFGTSTKMAQNTPKETPDSDTKTNLTSTDRHQILWGRITSAGMNFDDFKRKCSEVKNLAKQSAGWGTVEDIGPADLGWILDHTISAYDADASASTFWRKP